MIINALQGGHTDTDTDTDRQTDRQTDTHTTMHKQKQFKKPACTSLWPVHAWFKNMSISLYISYPCSLLTQCFADPCRIYFFFLLEFTLRYISMYIITNRHNNIICSQYIYNKLSNVSVVNRQLRTSQFQYILRFCMQ